MKKYKRKSMWNVSLKPFQRHSECLQFKEYLSIMHILRIWTLLKAR